MDIDLAALPDDVETLQKLVRSLAAERTSLREAQAEIERLNIIIKKLQRIQFGRRSERLVLPLQTSDLCRVVRRWQRRLRCRAPRRRRRLPPGPALFHPTPQHRVAQAKFLRHRPDRATTRCDQINRLPLVVVCERPTLTCFYSTPPGSLSLLQVSINSEEVHCARYGSARIAIVL
jgi:hypothetical protein